MSEIQRYDIGVNLMSRQFQKDRNEIVEKALVDGTGLIITGTDLDSSKAAIEFIRKNGYKHVFCTVGCHPHNAIEYDGLYASQMLQLIRKNRDIVVAVGECGLDFERMYSPEEFQIKTFRSMLHMASSTKLPVFLHERGAEEPFVKTMKTHKEMYPHSLVHCYTGNKQKVYRYLQMGFMIGITGWICDNRRNKDLLEAIRIIPLDRLMVETDSPYLTPHNRNLPRRNTPENLKYVIEKIAEVKRQDYHEVETALLKNTKDFFRI